MNASSSLVQIEKISKSFPGVQALKDANLLLRRGEVLGLVGENGAGKSTLMKVLSGIYPHGSYEGSLKIRGELMRFKGARDAEGLGVSMIHQELSVFPNLTIAENLFVGHWPSHSGIVNWKTLDQQAIELLAAVGASFHPQELMKNLSVGQAQLVEIAKALGRKSEILIMDEPTSALTPKEVRQLFKLIGQLRSQGRGIIYISHKLDEVDEICDRIAVLRDGQSIGEYEKHSLTRDKIIQLMVGRDLTALFPESPERDLENATEVLRVTDLCGQKRDATERLFGPIDFSLKRGEILGFAGLLGAGRTDVLKTLFGNPKVKTTGQIFLKNKKLNLQHPREALRSGIAFVSEDRKRESALLGRSLGENVSISRLSRGSLAHLLHMRREHERNVTSLKQLRTKTTGPDQLIQNLSGGNQQKVILGRALQIAPEVILLDEPTRGIDVGAKFEIYQILFELAQSGTSLIVVSSELPEVMALSDRIVVMCEGRQNGILARNEFTQERIMNLAFQHGGNHGLTMGDRSDVQSRLEQSEAG